MFNQVMNVNAHIGCGKSELSAEVSDSEFGYFTWTEASATLGLSMTEDAVREFARQANAAVAALDHFATAETRGEAPGDFQIRTGETGRYRTPEEIGTAIRHHIPHRTTATEELAGESGRQW